MPNYCAWPNYLGWLSPPLMSWSRSPLSFWTNAGLKNVVRRAMESAEEEEEEEDPRPRGEGEEPLRPRTKWEGMVECPNLHF